MTASTSRDAALLLELRARSLAVIALTDHPQVEVERESLSGLEILAHLRRGAALPCCQFGVEVQASLKQSWPGLAAVPSRISQAQKRLRRETVFPLCLFAYTVDTNEGQWRWLQEPGINPLTGAFLRFHDTGRLQPVDASAVEHIVAAVAAWYDARK